MTAAEIIEALSPHVKPERLTRLRHAVDHRMGGLAVVVEGLYDQGNRSAVYRSAEAHGLLNVHVVRPDMTTKPNARAVSRGAEKWITVHEHGTTRQCLRTMRDSGYQVFAADLRAARPLHTIDFSRPTALVFGNERDGITAEMREGADGTFIIPMRGLVESFNISVAASIALAHARTARENALGAQTDLDAITRLELYASYLLRGVPAAAEILSRKVADQQLAEQA